MANILLDSILNDTLRNSPLRDLVSAELRLDSDQFKNQPPSSLSPAAIQEQLNSLLGPSAPNTVEMGAGERLFWVLIFSVMVLVAAGGNTVVAYIVTTNKEMKSVTNYFLVNLSLADTMVSTLNVIFNFISMLISHWPFGKLYCKISNFIAILSISASVFTLTAISCDRYNAILHPLRPRMSHSHAIGWIMLIWTLSSALALPNAIYSTLVEDRLANDNSAITCAMIWPDGRYPLSSYDHIYNIVVLVVTYLVPILTMAILYYKVGKELWGHEAIGENVEKQQAAILAKRKIVKMMIVVVIIFALCWLPYHAFFVVNYYVPTIFQDVPLHYQRCYLFMYWLAMSNSMYNPIIIYFMNSKFKHEIRKILCFVFCCRRSESNQGAHNSSQTRHPPTITNNINCTTNLIDRTTNAHNRISTRNVNNCISRATGNTSRVPSLPASSRSGSGQSLSNGGGRERNNWDRGHTPKDDEPKEARSKDNLTSNRKHHDQIQVIISSPNSRPPDLHAINQPGSPNGHDTHLDEPNETEPFINGQQTLHCDNDSQGGCDTDADHHHDHKATNHNNKIAEKSPIRDPTVDKSPKNGSTHVWI